MGRGDDRPSGVRWAVYGLIAAMVVLLGYLAVSGFSAYRSLTAARTELSAAQQELSRAPQVAQQSLETAAEKASSAADTLNGPVWRLVSAVPFFGATPRAAGTVSLSLDQALTALKPAFGQLGVLNPGSLAQSGTINISAVTEAVPAAEASLPGIRRARQTLEQTPTSGLLLSQVSDASTQLDEQLSSLESTLTTAVTFGKIAGPLLGQDGQKRYFLGLLNPNETRGTGGFLGTYAILTAANGALTVDQIGSNTDLPNLKELPSSIGRQFRDRYFNDPILRGNMNLSPHFPDTAAIWLASWKLKTGEELDGAMAMDVVALGDLVTASGQPVTLPDGSQMDGEELKRFTIRDIYTQFSDAFERKEFQEAVAESGLATVTALPKPLPMGQALGQALTDHRIVIWTRDPAVEEELLKAGVGGSLVVADGHTVQAVVLNASGSKLDAWLSKRVQYDVGRCVTDGRVTSTVTVDLRSDVPLGERPPPYMVGSAQMGKNGPIGYSMLQVHLPNGAKLRKTTVNGNDDVALEFKEQDRPAAMIPVYLPPRETQRVSFTFTEPASDSPGAIQEQPLGSPTDTVITEVACS